MSQAKQHNGAVARESTQQVPCCHEPVLPRPRSAADRGSATAPTEPYGLHSIPTRPTRSIPVAIEQARKLVTPASRAAVDAFCPGMSKVCGYHHGWFDAAGEPDECGGGKAIRAALVLLSARAVGHSAEEAVPAAVAVELIHSFSLLHDDIMDADTQRRHRPTAWTVFGVPSAILGGDALLTAAIQVLLDQPNTSGSAAARVLCATTQRLISGQRADLDFERRSDVTLDECLRMAADKTSALISCAAAIGALFVGSTPQAVSQLASFGDHLGTAFQLVDDLLGIWGSTEVTGKPFRSDLRSRKKSLPVVAALRSGSVASAKLATLYSRAEPLEEHELRKAAQLVERAGGRRWAEAEAAAQLEQAAGCLADFDLPTELRTEFIELARFVTDRDH